jgi:RHS repeat-associated protein
MQGAGGVGGLLFTHLQIPDPGSQAPTPGVYAAAFDGNGNVSAYVDLATGSKSAAYEYGSFGETLIADGPMVKALAFRFSTKCTDLETGLIDYSQRSYDPNSGRFLSRDLIEEDGGVNVYGFVTNDPISNFDVLGLAGFFFDGTGNRERDRTNVSILRNVYDGFARYYPGVGSSFGTRIIGGLTGAGGRNRLEAAYRDFISFIDAGDRYVDIVGFSRGGALAREFANLLVERGYDPKYGGKLTHKLKAGRNVPPGACDFVIRFVGLFDTVGSFGVPGNNINIGIRMSLQNVLHAAQATARDEKRHLFPLTPLGPGEGFDEQSFPGDHSDIGRGHRKNNNDLSRAPLEYIWNQGRSAGVPFRTLPQYTPTGNATPHDLSRKFPHNLFPKRPR